MRKNLCNNVLRTSAFALACVALVGADVKADDLITATTTVADNADASSDLAVCGILQHRRGRSAPAG